MHSKSAVSARLRARPKTNATSENMKLVRFGPPGQEHPGILDSEARVRDLSGYFDDFNPAFFVSGGMKQLPAIDPDKLPLVEASARFGPCVAQPGNFIAVGLNYVQHAIETDAEMP